MQEEITYVYFRRRLGEPQDSYLGSILFFILMNGVRVIYQYSSSLHFFDILEPWYGTVVSFIIRSRFSSCMLILLMIDFFTFLFTYIVGRLGYEEYRIFDVVSNNTMKYIKRPKFTSQIHLYHRFVSATSRPIWITSSSRTRAVFP